MTNLSDSPFKGLVPYLEEDAAWFFGRERERDLIIANLLASRLTVLYGQSGVGKSSVLRAGVSYAISQETVRTIAAGERPRVLLLAFSSWRDDPLAGLLKSLDSAFRPLLPAGVAIEVPPTLTGAILAWSKATGSELLIVLDQFEEYFLYNEKDEGEGRFGQEFAQAINRQGLPANFLVSLREDAVAKLDRFKSRIPGLFDNYLRINHLTPEDARAAIEKPIAEYNRRLPHGEAVTIEPQLVKAVLDQVEAGKVVVRGAGQGLVANQDGESRIEAPYLQLVMTRLWAEEVAAGSHQLRLQSLEGLGGAQQVVRTHLDRAMDTLRPEEQTIASEIFRYLVTPSGTKIAHTAADLAKYSAKTPEEVDRTLEDLAGGSLRIIRPVAAPPDGPQETRYEIFHDVMATPVLDWQARFRERQNAKQAELAARKALAEARQERRLLFRRRVKNGLSVIVLAALVAGLVLYVADKKGKAAEKLIQSVGIDAELDSHNSSAAEYLNLRPDKSTSGWEKSPIIVEGMLTPDLIHEGLKAGGAWDSISEPGEELVVLSRAILAFEAAAERDDISASNRARVELSVVLMNLILLADLQVGPDRCNVTKQHIETLRLLKGYLPEGPTTLAKNADEKYMKTCEVTTPRLSVQRFDGNRISCDDEVDITGVVRNGRDVPIVDGSVVRLTTTFGTVNPTQATTTDGAFVVKFSRGASKARSATVGATVNEITRSITLTWSCP